MIQNRQSTIQANLATRSRVIRAVRLFFEENGFLEVETPIRIPAPAPEVHIDAQESGSWYLHTSPELCMKRLLASGFEKIFQICKCFRQNERGAKHLPEMTLLEWYEAGIDYNQMMDQCRALIQFVAGQLNVGKTMVYQKKTISLSDPWDRLTVADAFDRYASVSMDKALLNDRFDEIMGLEIEPSLGNEKPVFLYDYPAPLAVLSKIKSSNPLVAERFELYMAGVELCNGFTELIDSNEQRKRFEEENNMRKQAGKTIYPSPEPFLNALSSMPAASGNALGLDRLVMLFADTRTIDDVVAFAPEEL